MEVVRTSPKTDEIFKQLVAADETAPYAHDRLHELCQQAIKADQESLINRLHKHVAFLTDKLNA